MSCTAAVDSYAATISEVVGEIRLQLFLKEGPELTINVLKQRWKRKQQGYFRMKF
jgi:sulfate adenylyltransferase subunit 2